MADSEQLQTIIQISITSFGSNKRLSTKIINQIIQLIRSEGSLSVDEIISRFSHRDSMVDIYFYRTFVYLIKFDVLRLA